MLPLLLSLLACAPPDTGGDDSTPTGDSGGDDCTFFTDADGDGHGAPDTGAVSPCDAQPVGTAETDDDCDDGNGAVFPGADEVCNGADDDCDGTTDEDAVDGVLSWPDADLDGWGGGDGAVACEVPAGNVTRGGDCDEGDAAVNPDAVDEGCDGIDNDCDGQADGGWRVPEDQPNLQVAVSSAPEGGTVCVAPGTYDGPLDTRGKAITVRGYGGADVTTVRGVGRTRVVSITGGEGPDTVLQGLTISGGIADDGAGVYIVDSSPTLVDVVIADNSCVVTGTTGRCNGTGLYSEGGTPTLTRVTLRGNTQEAAGSFGAGLYVLGGGMVLDDVLIEENSQVDGADRSFLTGAGVYANLATLDLQDVEIRANTQVYDIETASESGALSGAGLHSESADITGVGVSITDNQQSCPAGHACNMFGAGLYASGVSGGAVSLSDTTIRGNSISATTEASAGGYGAGACVVYASFTLTDSVVEDNHLDVVATSPQAYGGGLVLQHQDTVMDRVSIAGNSISSGDLAYGGGLEMESATLTGTNVVIAGNEGASVRGTISGGGLFARETTLDLTNADVVGNNCTGGTCNGAAFNFYTTVDLVLRSTTMTDNGASGARGGAVYSNFGNVTIDAAWSNFYGNGSSPFYGATTPSAVDGNLFVDPLYTDTSAADAWDWDLTLAPGSPVIDAGDPSVTDVDGTRADIGSEGGPGGS